MIPISAYYPFYSSKRQTWLPGGKPYDSEFFAEMSAIISGKHRHLAERCRAIWSKEERSLFKIRNLPAFSVSCLCHTWRSRGNIIAHSGLMNIDIDSSDNLAIDDWSAFRDFISGLKFCVAAFISVSGKGLCFVVRIVPGEHHDAYGSIAFDLAKIGVSADKGTHDVTRLRFTSYDPGGFINPNDLENIPLYRPHIEYFQHKQSRYTLSIFPQGAVDSEENYLKAVARARLDYEFGDGSKHFFLVVVAGWCRHYQMSESFCLEMTQKHFGSLTAADVSTPVQNVYKTY